MIFPRLRASECTSSLRGPLLGAILSIAGGCAVGPAYTTTSVADLDIYLQQAGQACFATVGIRNRSDIRKGPAMLTMRWQATDGGTVIETPVRLDPVRVGYYDAKNVALEDSRCADIGGVDLLRADWAEFDLWKAGELRWRAIGGADGTRWRFEWRELLDAWQAVPDGR